jgi:hypothetical protein
VNQPTPVPTVTPTPLNTPTSYGPSSSFIQPTQLQTNIQHKLQQLQQPQVVLQHATTTPAIVNKPQPTTTQPSITQQQQQQQQTQPPNIIPPTMQPPNIPSKQPPPTLPTAITKQQLTLLIPTQQQQQQQTTTPTQLTSSSSNAQLNQTTTTTTGSAASVVVAPAATSIASLQPPAQMPKAVYDSLAPLDRPSEPIKYVDEASTQSTSVEATAKIAEEDTMAAHVSQRQDEKAKLESILLGSLMSRGNGMDTSGQPMMHTTRYGGQIVNKWPRMPPSNMLYNTVNRQVPHPNYVCTICKKPGHLKQLCPEAVS